MAYLTRNGGRRVYYEDHGTEAKSVLLIHGWGMSTKAWDTVLPALRSAGYRVVLFDHRGCGRSDRDFADMGIAAIAGDVVDLVETLALDDVVLNGWSLGGAVAVEAAKRLGSRCDALVLTGGATPIYIQKPDFPHGGSEADLEATLAGLSADRVTFLEALSHAVCAKEVGEFVERWLWHMFCDASPLARDTLAELGTLDQRATLAQLNLPILSFVGSEDGFVDPAIGRWLKANHPQVQLIEYEGVGHAPFLEVTDQYNKDLLAFLATR